MNPYLAIKATLQQEAPLPSFLNKGVELFTKCRFYYRYYRHFRIFKNASQNPFKGHAAVYGAALQIAADSTSIGSFALTIALTAKCAADLLEQQRQLRESYQKLSVAWSWQYPVYRSATWNRNKTLHLFITPSIFLRCQIQTLAFTKQIQQIGRTGLNFLWQIFKLSMSLTDAYQLFKADSQTRFDACTELSSDWKRYLNLLKDNQANLCDEIEKGSALADNLLLKLGSQKDSKSIISDLKQHFAGVSANANTFLGNLMTSTEETFDTVLVSGKITPLHIDFSQTCQISALPYSRFPSWGGQSVGLLNDSNQNTLIKIGSAPQSLLQNSISTFAMAEQWMGIPWNKMGF